MKVCMLFIYQSWESDILPFDLDITQIEHVHVTPEHHINMQNIVK